MIIRSLICARGGSKGVPKKNLVHINGLPLIYFAIKACKDAGLDTWVSTDDDDIIKTSMRFGASVIKRPAELATDTSQLEDAIEHFYTYVPDSDILVLVQPTSPMIKPHYLREGVDLLIDRGLDSVFSVCSTRGMLFWTLDLKPINYDPHKRLNRDYIEKYSSFYIETGSFYIMRRESFMKSKCRISGKIGIIETNFWESFEIDTYDDLINVGKLMK